MCFLWYLNRKPEKAKEYVIYEKSGVLHALAMANHAFRIADKAHIKTHPDEKGNIKITFIKHRIYLD